MMIWLSFSHTIPQYKFERWGIALPPNACGQSIAYQGSRRIVDNLPRPKGTGIPTEQ